MFLDFLYTDQSLYYQHYGAGNSRAEYIPHPGQCVHGPVHCMSGGPCLITSRPLQIRTGQVQLQVPGFLISTTFHVDKALGVQKALNFSEPWNLNEILCQKCTLPDSPCVRGVDVLP